MDNGGCNKNPHLSWDFSEVGSSRFDWNGFSTPPPPPPSSLTTTSSSSTTSSCLDLSAHRFNNSNNFNNRSSPSEMHSFFLHNPTFFKLQQHQNQTYHQQNHHHQQQQEEPSRSHYSSSSSSSAAALFMLPQPHFFSNNPGDSLTCLKLGKRQYFEDPLDPIPDQHVSVFSLGKKGKQGGGSSMAAVAAAAASAVPRCQVEGCNLGLLNAKEYHRRHKVCEMHSKAPKVVVHGIEQRFCQQCSRFHVVSEFDDAKRSCRRRLAGHNERRRKNSSDSINRNHSLENKVTGERYRLSCIASSATGRALSLLSSKTSSWASPADLSSRSSAALRELIVENRAAVLARQLFSDRSWHAMDDSSASLSHVQQQYQLPGFQFHEPDSHVCSAIVRPTLDLMQTADSSFPILSVRSKSKDDEEECDIWKSLEGTHVV